MALSVCEYGAPAVPSASEGAGMETGAGRMVSEYAADVDTPALSPA